MIKNKEENKMPNANKNVYLYSFYHFMIFTMSIIFLSSFLYVRHTITPKQVEHIQDKNSMQMYAFMSKDLAELNKLFSQNTKVKEDFKQKLFNAYPLIKIKDNAIYSNTHGVVMNIINNGVTFKANNVLCSRIKKQMIVDGKQKFEFYKGNERITEKFDCMNIKENTELKIVF